MNTRITGVWIKDYCCVSWQRLWAWIPVLRAFESSQRCTPGRPLCTWIPVLRVFELNRGEHMLNGLLHEYPYYGCLNWIEVRRCWTVYCMNTRITGVWIESTGTGLLHLHSMNTRITGVWIISYDAIQAAVEMHEYPYYGCLNSLPIGYNEGTRQHEYPYYGCLNILC